jgi:deazaflavin-dependent oxidoreductase (nitroreductase family)
MADAVGWNQKIIDEFRANEGKVGGHFEGAPLLLLTTTGAKTGRRHTTPVMFLPGEAGTLYVFASKAGAPTNPDWYHNLLAHPEVTIEVGTDTHHVVATPLEGVERDQRYAAQAENYPGFAEYQQKTSRVIPVVALAPK